ncbi:MULTISPECIES: hypothetical protein [unclassified Microbacterium]|uniref:hypothetical protein n=1 Tax=unclassified Microbacterium TaxID=2609290 RepID=UPI001D5101F2|nr:MULTISPECIES: hypothetical protein [unclassified Microbacterium]CAH0143350.1 hypothetical protein SRABI121_01064 [Microbacterium sp. Bi121]HWK77805.1 hypothetical protein [Microbacterium sp.]
MSDQKSTRRELLRPLHLLGIALAAGVFAAVVTLVSTGAFTSRVNNAIASGTYQGLTPVGLGLVIGGGAFIVTLLILSMLILAVDPREYEDKTLDRPVLYDKDDDGEPSGPASAAPKPSAAEPSAPKPSDGADPAAS